MRVCEKEDREIGILTQLQTQTIRQPSRDAQTELQTLRDKDREVEK